MTLADGQYSYRGLTFGPGCELAVNSAEGFEGFEVRTADSDQPRGDGGIRGIDYVAPRTLAFELVAWEPDGDGTAYEGLWSTVRAAFRASRDTDYPLTFKRPGAAERIIWCRPISLVRRENWETFGRYGYPPVVLRAVDPRIYSAEAHSGNVPVYAATGGGLEFPVNFPTEFTGIAGSQVEFVAENAGTADAFPLIRFYGPAAGSITEVKLTNTTTDQAITITTGLGSGQILTADMAAAVAGTDSLVISLDGASRYGSWQLPREPLALAPGSNTLRYEIAGTATGSVCNLLWRDTWMD